MEPGSYGAAAAAQGAAPEGGEQGIWDNDEPTFPRSRQVGLSSSPSPSPSPRSWADLGRRPSSGPSADSPVLPSLGRHLEVLSGLLQRQPRDGSAQAACSELTASSQALALALSRQLRRPARGDVAADRPEERREEARRSSRGPLRGSAGAGCEEGGPGASGLEGGTWPQREASVRSGFGNENEHQSPSTSTSEARDPLPKQGATARRRSDPGPSRPSEDEGPTADASSKRRFSTDSTNEEFKMHRSGTMKTLTSGKRGTASSSELLDEASFTFRSFRMLREFVSNTMVESFFALMVVINCLAMVVREECEGIQQGARLGYYTHYGTDEYMKGWWPQLTQVLFVLECVFAVLFTFEVTLMLTYDIWNLKLGIRSDVREPLWTQPLEVMDAGVIWVSNVILVANLTGPLSRMKFIRILRLLRIGRLVRAIRHFHFLDPLHLMATALKGSVGAMLFSTVIFFGVLTMFAMVFAALMRWEYLNDESTLPDTTKSQLFIYFGTYSRAMVSMTELALANWPKISRFLAEEVHEGFSVFCVLFKWVVGFAVLAVLNGIFIQETLSAAANDEFIMVRARMRQNVESVKKITRLFAFADEDGNGFLTKDELEVVLNKPKIRAWLEAMELRFADAGMLFDMIAGNGQEAISSEDFIQGIGRLKGPARNLDVVKVIDMLSQSQQQDNKEQTKSIQEATFAMNRSWRKGSTRPEEERSSEYEPPLEV